MDLDKTNQVLIPEIFTALPVWIGAPIQKKTQKVNMQVMF